MRRRIALLAVALCVLLIPAGCFWHLPGTAPGTDNAPPVDEPAPPANRQPKALFMASDYTPDMGQLVEFDGTWSEDPDGIIVAWQWTIAWHSVQTAPIAQARFTTPGRKRITLQVQDNDGAWSELLEFYLTVLGEAPCTPAPAPPPGGGCSSGSCQ